jgi:hypothetical protein
MSKLYNAAIAFSNNDGTVGVSLTNNLATRLTKFNLVNHSTFKTFSFENSMTLDEIVNKLLLEDLFVNNDNFNYALKHKLKKKVIKTNVADILTAIQDTTKELA